MKETNDRAELDALRQLPPEAVAGLLGLTHDQAAQRRHGGAGYSYWRMPDGALITLRMGRACWIWHPTQRDGGGGGDWLALYQHLHPAASLGHARRALRQALAGGQAAPARASAHLLAPQAAATATVAPARPLQLCDAPAWGIDYLHRERGIPMPTLKWALAMGAIMGHKPGYQPDPKAIHLAFPHTQRDGDATWAELRGPVEAHGARSKKASRGFKGLWILPPATESRVMVVTESAVKGLALHARLAQANRQAWIASTGGDPGKHQQQMLAWLVDELGIETTALAQDSDTPGQRQADRLAAALGTHAHKIVRMPPPGGFVGWDDWAMAQRG